MRQTTCRAAVMAAAVAATLGGTLAAQAAELATVVSSTPVIVSVMVPRQQCSDGQQLVQQRPSGAGALLGAIAGGVIGHNVGNGFGRAAATGIGAVTGAVVGDQVEAANSPVTEVPVRRCQTVSSYENRTVGYDVVYDYAGSRRTARLAQNPGGPGTQIAVDVNVSPSGGAVRSNRNGAPVPQANARRSAPMDDGAVGQLADSGAQTYYEDRRYAPAPVYYEPAPVYYQPAPAYYSPVVVAAPPVVWIGGSWGHRRHHRGW